MADYSEEDPVLRNRIIADEGEYGTVDVSTDFGDASAGSEIYIRHYAGMGGAYYDVTKKQCKLSCEDGNYSIR